MVSFTHDLPTKRQLAPSRIAKCLLSFKRETGVEPATLSNAEQTDLDAERGDIIAGSADYSADGWCFMTYKPN